MGKSFKMAWRNMWRNWRRTAIALTAIVLGLILLLFMNGLIHGSDQGIYGNAVRFYGGNIQVHAPGYRVKANRMPLLPLADPATVVAVGRGPAPSGGRQPAHHDRRPGQHPRGHLPGQDHGHRTVR